ncbi:MAG: DUF5069 domain-containing protein [Parafilimonas sp.]
MNTNIGARDLAKQSPHSPRKRVDGFVIAARTIDKCLAYTAGTLGEYHYDCPLDNVLFSFKGITGAQFTTAVAGQKIMTRSALGCKVTALRKQRTKSKPGPTESKPAA